MVIKLKRRIQKEKNNDHYGIIGKRAASAGAMLLLPVLICAGSRNAGAGLADTSMLFADRSFGDGSFTGEESVPETVRRKAAEVRKADGEGAEEEEPEGGFHVRYQGQEADYPIEFRYCDCVYDTEEIQIYAEYLDWLMVPEGFPCYQYVLYVRTPWEELQLYPVKDFLVDDKQGILYTKISGENGFESVKSMPFTEKSGRMQELEKVLFDAETAQEMLCDAFEVEAEEQAAGGEGIFSDVLVELTEVSSDEAGVIRGEAFGIERASGKRRYVDWEIDTKSGRIESEACVLKRYDPVKDQEAFTECGEIFDRIEQGDWSDVKAPEEYSYLWEMQEEEWSRLDVNGDGMPELLGGWVIEELPDYDSRKIMISLIFAWQDGMAELVYVDVNDGMEFLFITAEGELVYEWGVSGGPGTNIFRRCQFDLKWEKEYLDTLVRYRFTEDDEERATESFREFYADTFGTGGVGVYYLRERPKTQEELARNGDGKYTVREYLTEEQFLRMYEDLTGWDFYKAQDMY